MRVFTSDVKTLTRRYTKIRDKVDCKHVSALGRILKLNAEAVKGIELVEKQCASEKKALNEESAEARKILEDIANG